MDALELFNGALDVLRTDLRDSKNELIRRFDGRFDSQDGMLKSLDGRVREANGKTADNVTAIAVLRRDVDALGAIKFHEGRSALQPESQPEKPKNLIEAVTMVAIAWGNTKWFAWVLWLTIASVGGEKVYLWGKAIIGLFTPHS